MLPAIAPKPKDWTDKDRWICVKRWLEVLTFSLFHSFDPEYPGIDFGEKGDPCYECPAGERCPAYCDETHWLQYSKVYAYENFKVVEQFAGSRMGVIDAILKEIDETPQTVYRDEDGNLHMPDHIREELEKIELKHLDEIRPPKRDPKYIPNFG